MIHRPDALPVLLSACEGRLGAVAVRPVLSRAGADAARVLLAGVKGSRAPLRITAPLVLHEDDGAFTAEAEAIHRGEGLVAM
jgi:tRNA1(Val) A37 N6-methylase TrmN6